MHVQYRLAASALFLSSSVYAETPPSSAHSKMLVIQCTTSGQPAMRGELSFDTLETGEVWLASYQLNIAAQQLHEEIKTTILPQQSWWVRMLYIQIVMNKLAVPEV